MRVGHAARSRSDLATVCSIAAVAYVACDLIHEVLGHGLACQLSPGVTALSLSTVALQTSGSSRLVAAAGSIANFLAGIVAFATFRRDGPLRPSGYFVWLLATINLMNAAAYLIFSALLDFGDWAVVIAGLGPHWAWRMGMGVIGVVLCVAVVKVAAARLARMVNRGQLDPNQVGRLVVASYLTGGLLLTTGAALNPIGPALILLSGASTGFGAMAGLLFVPGIVDRTARAGATPGKGVELSSGWIVMGAVVAILFVALLGPGITFRH